MYNKKPVLSGHPKRGPKLIFQDQLSLNAGQKYCRMLPFKGSILQFFPPSLSYHLSSRSLYGLFFEWPLKTGFTLPKSQELVKPFLKAD